MTAADAILTGHGMTQGQVHGVMGYLLGGSVDAADLYFQTRMSEHWFLEDGLVKEGAYHYRAGVGVRVLVGAQTGFAYTEDIQPETLQHAAQAAKSIAPSVCVGPSLGLRTLPLSSHYAAENPLTSISEQEKTQLLQRLDQYVRAQDPRIVQVMLSLTASYETVLIAHSDQTLCTDHRPMVRCHIQVIVAQHGRREVGTYGGGGRYDYRYFLDSDRPKYYADQAVRMALLNLDAKPAPAGSMPVVLGPGWPGVLLHEAVGHGLEADFNRKKTSVFSDRIGQKVASSLCTVVDDGTLAGRRGSLNVDDEGTPTQRTVLIEKGVLKGYLQDKLSARLMNMAPTGNGRRASYADMPMPRMTNTYLLPGHHDPHEILGSVSRGIYAVNFSGGQVDITSGNFVFTTSEAYLIENGRITTPIKDATLIGNGPDVIQKISMVGNDLALDEGTGTCGKDGQSVPVGVGQPTIKVDELTVGGTA